MQLAQHFLSVNPFFWAYIKMAHRHSTGLALDAEPLQVGGLWGQCCENAGLIAA